MNAKKVKNYILITLSYLAAATILMAMCCVDSLPLEFEAYGIWLLIVGACVAWLALFFMANKDILDKPCKLEKWIDKKLEQAEEREKKQSRSEAIKDYYFAERKVQYARNKANELSKVS